MLWIFGQSVLSGVFIAISGSKMPIIVNWSAGGEFETIDCPWFRWEIKEGIPAAFRSHEDPPVRFLIRSTSGYGEQGVSTWTGYRNQDGKLESWRKTKFRAGSNTRSSPMCQIVKWAQRDK